MTKNHNVNIQWPEHNVEKVNILYCILQYVASSNIMIDALPYLEYEEPWSTVSRRF